MEVKTPTIVRTLIGSGFQIAKSVRKPSYLVFHAYRRDEFGVRWHYLFAYSGSRKLSEGDLAGLRSIASTEGASLIVIGEAGGVNDQVPTLSPEDFTARLGGAIPSFLPLEPGYADQLKKLGRNELPPGLAGQADNLFEAYVHAGLEFLLQERVVRYGQDRRFEVVPDGLVMGQGPFILLYDCKAAKKGYHISRDSIRQFADYVKSFHQRYEKYTGRLHAFLLISGEFQSEGTLEARSRELYAECKVPLVFLAAGEMGKIVTMMADRPAYRQSIDWQSIFSESVIRADEVDKYLQARTRDKIIRS